MIDVDLVHSWVWEGTAYHAQIGQNVDFGHGDSIFNGYPGATGHIDVYVDRDHEIQDPPPSGSVPVQTWVELMAMPERILIQKKLTSLGGFIRFSFLEPTRTYAVFSLGIQKQDGSGDWYVAEMYDRLIPISD